MALFVLYCQRRAFEAQDYPEAEQQCQAALAVDPQHQAVNKELQLQLCRVQQMLNKPQEAVEVSHLSTTAVQPWVSSTGHTQPAACLLQRVSDRPS